MGLPKLFRRKPSALHAYRGMRVKPLSLGGFLGLRDNPLNSSLPLIARKRIVPARGGEKIVFSLHETAPERDWLGRKVLAERGPVSSVSLFVPADKSRPAAGGAFTAPKYQRMGLAKHLSSLRENELSARGIENFLPEGRMRQRGEPKR